MERDTAEEFAGFVDDVGGRLRLALIAAFGPEVGAEATAQALEYAREHWDRVRHTDNPGGYLYRVGQRTSRRYRRRPKSLPALTDTAQPWFEPGLPKALNQLSWQQRTAVLLCRGYGWTPVEAAAMLGVTPSAVQQHLDRGMEKVRRALGVTSSD